MKGICPISLMESEIRDSHIFPKFMYEYLNAHGGNRNFIDTSNPKRISQNGTKTKMLGAETEESFSKREKWFAEKIFVPYNEKRLLNNEVEYGQEFFYYTVSQLWRLLHYNEFISNRDEHPFFNPDYEELYELCSKAKEEWRVFLNDGITPQQFCNFYIMPLNSFLSIIPSRYFEIDFYIRRCFDSNIFCSDTGDRVMYCKLPNMIIWGILSDCEPLWCYGRKIDVDGGFFNMEFDQYDDEIIEYIYHRIGISALMLREDAQNFSDQHVKRLYEKMSKSPNLKNSELGEILSLRKMPTVERPDEDTIIFRIE